MENMGISGAPRGNWKHWEPPETTVSAPVTPLAVTQLSPKEKGQGRRLLGSAEVGPGFSRFTCFAWGHPMPSLEGS